MSKKLFLFQIIVLIQSTLIFAKNSNDIVPFSDNQELNTMIKEVYVYSVPANYKQTKITICFGLKAKSSEKYYNYIRIGDENKGPSAYVEILSQKFDTYQDAIGAVKNYKGIIESQKGFIKCDFSNISSYYSKSFNCRHSDIKNLDNSSDIKKYLHKNKLFPKIYNVKTKALKNSINGTNTYQCVDQFLDLSEVRVFKNDIEVSPENYNLYKQGKVQFKDNEEIKEGNIYFKYTRRIKSYKSFSNDLSNNVSEFDELHSGCEGEMYSFVADPIDKNRNVLMISCSKLLKDAQNAREQFSNTKYPLTYFKDKIKILLPQEMKDAMLSYPKAINWFSIQGSWCQFGSPIGEIKYMYSGSGNSFGISKPSIHSKELYFQLLCRRRHCDPDTGIEIYDVLNNELSSFPVKAGEWITIEREWRVGNPGLCRHIITDSDGKHEFTVEAYNCVCDPENEVKRYGSKYIGENPYNVCYPFICKLYTNKDLAQYCIDNIGCCSLYYKDYELIEAQNVNAL